MQCDAGVTTQQHAYQPGFQDGRVHVKQVLSKALKVTRHQCVKLDQTVMLNGRSWMSNISEQAESCSVT